MISQRNETLDRAPLSGKVALVTGAARGQGRSHVVELAKCGADIIALDSCRNDVSVPYSLATFEDLQRTAAMAEEAGARVHASIADVRDYSALLSAVDDGVRALGCVDVVVANAGTVAGVAPLWELSEAQFRDQFDVNVFGVWNTVRATIPQMIKQQAGGSVILIGSVSAMAAELNLGHYAASKHAVLGLMRTLAVEVAPYSIRVNSVNPTSVNTPMIDNPYMNELFAGPGAQQTDALDALKSLNALPIPFVEPIDVSHAVIYLASEASRYVTGSALVVDAGALSPFKIPH